MLLVEKRNIQLEEMLDYIEEFLIPYNMTLTKKMNYDEVSQLYLGLKDIETIFEAITECAYIFDAVKNLKN